jgi:tape measure domain-containing protein
MADGTVGSASVQLTGDTSQFAAAMRQAAAQMQKFGRDVGTALSDVNRKVSKFGADAAKQFEALDRRMAGGFGALGGRLSSVGRSLSTHVTLPLSIAGGGALAAGVKMDTLRRALLAVAGSSAEADRQLTELKEIAKLPGIGLVEAVQGSVRLQAIGASAATAERALKGFANAVALTGGGKAELERITVQLGQLSAKGRILAQDLRPIIESGPAVAGALKAAFGSVDAEEIQALGLTTEQFLDVLLTELEKLPKVSAGAKNVFEELQTALLLAGDAIAKTFLPALTELANKLSGFLTKVSEADQGVLRWAVAFGAVAAAMGPVLLLLGQLTTAIAGLAAATGLGLAPLLGVGGAVIVGLGLLGAAFLRAKLEAAALRSEHERLVGALSQGIPGITTVAQAERHVAAVGGQLERARATLQSLETTERQQTERAVARAATAARSTREGAPARPIVTREMEQTTVALEHQRRIVTALEESYKRATAHAQQLASVPPPKPPPAAGAAVLARGFGPLPAPETLTRLLDGLTEARERLAELRFEESTFSRSAEDARKLADEIAGVARQVRELENALRIIDIDRAFGPTPTPTLAPIARPGAGSIVPIGRGLQPIHEPTSLRKEAEDAADEFLRWREILESLNTPLQALAQQVAGIGLAAADAFGDMGAALVEFVVEGGARFKDFADRLHDLFHSFVQGALQDLARLLARIALVKAVQALFPGTVFAESFAIAAGVREKGGPVRKDEPYLVGEAGPELFVPTQAGRILPHTTTERLTGARGGALRSDRALRPGQQRGSAVAAFLRDSDAGEQTEGGLLPPSLTRATMQLAASVALLALPAAGAAADRSELTDASVLREQIDSWHEAVSVALLERHTHATSEIGRSLERVFRTEGTATLHDAPSFAIPDFAPTFAPIANLVARAHGGPVLRNHSYLVGERGPELYVPSAAGSTAPGQAPGGTITLRMDLSKMPPVPRPTTPQEAATHDWYRMLFSHLKLDYDDRGGK